MLKLGPFEREILQVLIAHPQNAYGVPILGWLKEAFGRDYSVGALYTTLERLEKKGLVKSEWGEPTAERGGRRKRYYQISASGHRAYTAAQSNIGILDSFKGVEGSYA